MKISILILTICCFRFAVPAGPAREDALPKTVWTYSTPKGQDIVHDLCIERLLSLFEEEQWILEIITPNNILTYIKDYDGYRKTVLAAQLSNDQIPQLQLLKLYILRQYGGLWVDPDVILFGDLSWISQLSKLSQIDRFEHNSYELVMFSTISNRRQELQIQKNEEDGYPFKQTAVMLGLKDSLVLNDWIQRIKIQVESAVSSPNWSESHRNPNFIKQISLRALSALLSPSNMQRTSSKSKSNKSPLTYYGIWEFRYTDYQQMFQNFAASDDTKLIVDYYIKEDIRSIKKFSGSPKYFIWLGGVNQQLNYILNPYISSLQIISPIPLQERLWQTDATKLKCMHYLMNHSLIYNYLIHSSKLAQSKLIPVYQRDVLKQCETSYLQSLRNKSGLLLKCFIGLILLFLVFKIYRIVTSIAVPILLAKLKLKLSNLRFFLFGARPVPKSYQPI